MSKRIPKDSLIGIGVIVLLVIWSITLFWLALISGVEATDGIVVSLVANVPNALLWLVPIGLLYVTWKHQVVGGFLFLVFGSITILIFDTHQSVLVLLVISIPAIVLGGLLMTQSVWDKSVPIAKDQHLTDK